jgi:hypothetical protein
MADWHCTVNGTKYGPVPLEQLRQWIAEGRVTACDLVWTEGMASWQAASSVAALADAAPPGGAAPVPSAPPAPPGYYTGAVLPNAPGAVGGMICGIVGTVLSCMCFGSIVSIILGIVAIQQSRKARDLIAMNPLAYGGRGMASAGMVLGIISICLGAISTLYVLGAIVRMASVVRYRGF